LTKQSPDGDLIVSFFKCEKEAVKEDTASFSIGATAPTSDGFSADRLPESRTIDWLKQKSNFQRRTEKPRSLGDP